MNKVVSRNVNPVFCKDRIWTSAAKKLHDNITVYTFTVSSLLLSVGWHSQYLNYIQLQASMNMEHWYDMKSLISSENQPSNICAKILQMFLKTKLNPFRRTALEKSIVTQLLKKYLTFYRTQRLISTFTTAHHLPVPVLSQINPVHISPHHPISWRPTLISIHAYVFHVISFCQVFPTKILYAPLFSPYVPYALPISSFLVCSTEWLARSKHHAAPHC